MKISVFNGGGQTDYMYGLVSGLSQCKDDKIYVLDVDINAPLFLPYKNIVFIKVLKALAPGSSRLKKTGNILGFYFRQFYHLTFSTRGIVHFQWLDRYYIPDRILLPVWARLMGHKVVLTVHNINSKKRDNNDTLINQITLRAIYRLSQRLIVHTHQSKAELTSEFPVNEQKIIVVPHGINNRVSVSGISRAEARKRSGIGPDEKVILFFGNIDYYKGVDLLLLSFRHLPVGLKSELRLIIAGNSKSKEVTAQIEHLITGEGLDDRVTCHIRHIPDNSVENYFMAVDCIVLPYRNIYQSGVIFMAYAFGLPVIVPDIGNFRHDVVHGKTGLLSPGSEPEQLAGTISDFFKSALYTELPATRAYIKEWAKKTYSWESIGEETRQIYKSIK